MVVEQFNFDAFMATLDAIGFYTVALPFLLIFTIIFALLEKIQIFGEKSKRFNLLIALVMAFLVIRVQSLVELMNNFLPQISFLAVVLIVFLLLLGLLMGRNVALSKFPLLIGVVIVAGFIVYALATSSGAFATGLPAWLKLTSQDRNILIAIGLFFVFIWFVIAEPGSGKDNPWIKIGDALQDGLGGGK